MRFKGYGVYSADKQMYWSEKLNDWTPWMAEATSYPSKDRATTLIENKGWTQTTRAIKHGAYICEIMGP